MLPFTSFTLRTFRPPLVCFAKPSWRLRTGLPRLANPTLRISTKTTSTPSPSPPPHHRRTILLILTLLSWIPAYDFLTTHVISIARVTGPSMSPFLNTPSVPPTRDHLILFHYRCAENLHRGQIIAFWSPHNPDNMAVKRVVALEGDRVIARGCRGLTRGFKDGEVVNVDGGVWVEGDNAEESLDSNVYGVLSRNLVIGSVVGVVWPWGRRGWVSWEDWGGCERVTTSGGKAEKVEFYG